MGHTHKWGGWNQWTQTCHASRSRQCTECHETQVQTRTGHVWRIVTDNGKHYKECRKCGTRA